MDMFRRMLPALVLGATLVLSPFAPIQAATDDSCAAGESIPALEVRAEARREAYRIGQKASVEIHVTDSLSGQPQSDVNAGALLWGRRDKVLHGYDRTDAEGRVLLRLRLREKAVKPGWARVGVAAWDPVNTPVYCTGRSGSREYRKLFRIRP